MEGLAGLQHLRNRPSRGLCRSFINPFKMSNVAEIRQNVFLSSLTSRDIAAILSTPISRP